MLEDGRVGHELQIGRVALEPEDKIEMIPQAVDKIKRTAKMGGPCIYGLILTATNNFATLLGHSAHTNICPIFNTPHSPDLSPIENCWRAVNLAVRNTSPPISITGLRLMELVLAGWKRIPQSKINQTVDSMIVRMQQVLAFGGLMTGW